MMNETTHLTALIASSVKSTVLDVLPIIFVLVFFQIVAIRKKFPRLRQTVTGFILVVIGLSLFIVGLDWCIFPIGKQMAIQLTDLSFLNTGYNPIKKLLSPGELSISPALYFWTYVFAFLIGFSTTLAEPSLIAVAIKAREISTGAISEWGLRIAVALGVAIGVTLGAYRIVAGTPLYIYIAAGYGFLLIQTFFAPKIIIPLAYDSGGVTTSTVTVPLLVSLGIGLSTNVPGRSPLLDGFGLIAFASLFPMITVMGYAMITGYLAKPRSEDL